MKVTQEQMTAKTSEAPVNLFDTSSKKWCTSTMSQTPEYYGPTYIPCLEGCGSTTALQERRSAVYMHVGSGFEWWNCLFLCAHVSLIHDSIVLLRSRRGLAGRLPFHPTETLLHHLPCSCIDGEGVLR